MTTSKGVLQGYNGIAVVDDKNQVIIHTEAFGKGPEDDLLEPMIECVNENFRLVASRWLMGFLE